PAAIEIVEGTDGEVSGIIHPSVIVKEAGSDDAVTENVIFTPEMMRIVMDIAGHNKHHQAPLIINDTEDGVRVQFPAAELANAMSEIPEIELEIILNGAGYQLKIAALELDKLAERLGVTLED